MTREECDQYFINWAKTHSQSPNYGNDVVFCIVPSGYQSGLPHEHDKISDEIYKLIHATHYIVRDDKIEYYYAGAFGVVSDLGKRVG